MRNVWRNSKEVMNKNGNTCIVEYCKNSVKKNAGCRFDIYMVYM